MKTTFTVSAKDLSELLFLASKLQDDNWTISNWILDVIGLAPESGHDWNELSKEEINHGFDENCMLLCCRDSFHEMHCDKVIDPRTSRDIVASWIEAVRLAELPNAFAARTLPDQFSLPTDTAAPPE